MTTWFSRRPYNGCIWIVHIQFSRLPGQAKGTYSSTDKGQVDLCWCAIFELCVCRKSGPSLHCSNDRGRERGLWTPIGLNNGCFRAERKHQMDPQKQKQEREKAQTAISITLCPPPPPPSTLLSFSSGSDEVLPKGQMWQRRNLTSNSGINALRIADL